MSFFESANLSEKLVNISTSITRMRISNLVALVNSLAFVLLVVMYSSSLFGKEYKIIALVAL